jgi:diguanylate cyclase (GGDEF)-like protein/putative nucleotidyltransferase with HDIG domain
MIAAGTASLLPVALHPQWEQMLQFSMYLACILLASGMKLIVPRTDGKGTMSVNFVFILLAIMQLSLPEAMIAGCLSAVAQSLFRVRKGFRPVQIAFNVANIATATLLASFLYHRLLHIHAPLGIAIAGASALYFLANTTPVAALLALESRHPISRHWFRTFHWYFPFFLFGAIIAALIQVTALHYGWPASLLIFPVAWALYASFRSYLDRLQDHKQYVEQISEVHLRTIETLALAIEAKDQSTHDHLRRVRVYACEVGKELGLDAREMEALRAAALLHDIGKLAVPEHIINKPGKLTPEEFERMKIHPVVGAEILERVNFPYPVVPIVRSHHERWDGRGYPDGLAGDQIPIGARILTAVDCLDALATDRPYRRALSLDEAMRHLRELSGTQFDPQVVEVLERRSTELEALAHTERDGATALHLDIHIARGESPGAGFERFADASLDVDDAAIPALTDRMAERVHWMAEDLKGATPLQDALTSFAAKLKTEISFETIALYQSHGDTLRPCFISGEDRALFSSLAIPIGEGLSGWVAQNQRPIVNGNPSVEPGYLNDTSKFSKLRSALAVPWGDPESETSGVLVLYAIAADAFTRDDLRLLTGLSTSIAPCIQAASAAELSSRQADNDSLTQALTSRAFFSRFDEELRHCGAMGQPLSIVTFDLDDFKQVNETFGHVQGNRLLIELADRFRGATREGDVLARLGGDEFVLLLPGLDSHTAEARIRDLRAAVRVASERIFNDRHSVTASFGKAFYPEDGTRAEDLLAVADKGMYRAKRSRYLRADREMPRMIALAGG